MLADALAATAGIVVVGVMFGPVPAAAVLLGLLCLRD